MTTEITTRGALEQLATALRARATELEAQRGRIAPYAVRPITLRGWADEIESSSDADAVDLYRRVAAEIASSAADGTWGHVAAMTHAGARYAIVDGVIVQRR